jgi:hypothetical protein
MRRLPWKAAAEPEYLPCLNCRLIQQGCTTMQAKNGN